MKTINSSISKSVSALLWIDNNKKNKLKYHILYERLPRIWTRQSSSFYDLNYSDGFKIILKIIKKLNNLK